MTRLRCWTPLLACCCCLLEGSRAFAPARLQATRHATLPSPLFQQQQHDLQHSCCSQHSAPNSHNDPAHPRRHHLLQRALQRVLDTTAGAPHTQTAGLFSVRTLVSRIHNPITYLLLSAVAGFRWDWCFRNPYYWFAVGFCIKWYRARYVFKIPVWDRQPNWNNIITSKEQEKDLKAFTCKQCGSTLFIAKTREFFFEGDTGIGGLGCFSCGAKGKENFVQDRDRIVEDVADMDDYFEYERPLDFVSRAERRKLLKETQGDEDAANRLLVERESQPAAQVPESLQQSEVVDAEIVEDEQPTVEETVEEEPPAATDAETVEEPAIVEATEPDDDSIEEAPTETVAPPAAQVPPPTPAPKPAPTPAPKPVSDDDLDILDMD